MLCGCSGKAESTLTLDPSPASGRGEVGFRNVVVCARGENELAKRLAFEIELDFELSPYVMLVACEPKAKAEILIEVVAKTKNENIEIDILGIDQNGQRKIEQHHRLAQISPFEGSAIANGIETAVRYWDRLPTLPNRRVAKNPSPASGRGQGEGARLEPPPTNFNNDDWDAPLLAQP